MCSVQISKGTIEDIVDTAQQLAWIGAAFRTSQPNSLQYSEAKMTGGRGVFSMVFHSKPLPKDTFSCWYQLFTDPVIVRGFPVPKRRNNEQGLEISTNMMAALMGARHAVVFESGFLIKGFSAMAIPIRGNRDSTQWHLITNDPGVRMPYQEGSLRCPDRLLLNELDETSLHSTRSFLGWWEKGETNLGSGSINYRKTGWSSAKESGRTMRISGATLGYSKVLTAQANFVLGPKDGTLHFSQPGPFDRVIRSIETYPVTLYDFEDRRAWLVSALDVLLHTMATRNSQRPYMIGGRSVHLRFTQPHLRDATRQALLQNKSIQLVDDSEYYYKDAILEVWSQLEAMIDETVRMAQSPGVPIRNPFHDTLRGWEFMSLVEETPISPMKTRNVKRTSGEWVGLVKDLAAVTLFGRGFGELIRPIRVEGLCQQWQCLPKGHDYLALGCRMLDELRRKAGSANDRNCLTSTGLRLSLKPYSFGHCTRRNAGSCDCERLQKIIDESSPMSFRRSNMLFSFPEHGCIVIGQKNKSLGRTLTSDGTSSSSSKKSVAKDSKGKGFFVRSRNAMPEPKARERRLDSSGPRQAYMLEEEQQTRAHHMENAATQGLPRLHDTMRANTLSESNALDPTHQEPRGRQGRLFTGHEIGRNSSSSIQYPETGTIHDTDPDRANSDNLEDDVLSEPTTPLRRKANFERGRLTYYQDAFEDENIISVNIAVELNTIPPTLRHKGTLEGRTDHCICKACRLERNSQYRVT